eukprot:2146225-Alexandrium_andersonii.AAC.1
MAIADHARTRGVLGEGARLHASDGHAHIDHNQPDLPSVCVPAIKGSRHVGGVLGAFIDVRGCEREGCGRRGMAACHNA